MSHAEYVNWLAYNSVSPISDERCYDIGHALIRQMITSLFSKKKTKTEDFMPFKLEKTMDELIMEWAIESGGTIGNREQ